MRNSINAILVNKKIPSNASAAGNPARVIRENVFFLRDSVHKWTESVSRKHMLADTEDFVFFDSTDVVDMDNIDTALKAVGISVVAVTRKKKVEELLVSNTCKNRFFLPTN